MLVVLEVGAVKSQKKVCIGEIGKPMSWLH